MIAAMKRREFITLLGGAAVAWPLAARAQQPERMRRIAILMSTIDDAEGQARIAALREGMEKLGWTEGRNVRIDMRWAAGDADRMRSFVTEVVQTMAAQYLRRFSRSRSISFSNSYPRAFNSCSSSPRKRFNSSMARGCACVISLIGSLPDTLHDRSIVIDLRRRLPKEKITAFRLDRAGHLDVLARKAARWAADNAERVAAADPIMPDGVINREADNWRPLAAIAAVAGGRWFLRQDATKKWLDGICGMPKKCQFYAGFLW